MLAIIGLASSFLTSGAISTPRRFAAYIPEWMGAAQFGAISGIFVVLAVMVFIVHFIRYLMIRSKVETSTQLERKLS